MTTRLYDAHLHLQDERLGRASMDSNSPEAVLQDGIEIVYQLSNGTCPEDWASVSSVTSSQGATVLRAYGVHPWKVENLPGDWNTQLESLLKEDAASVGEIGLDHWIEPRDEELQIQVFERQLELAAKHSLPPSIHCLRAWGLLIDCLKNGPRLENGFLVHGFGGSKEVLYQLADLGGYFSFSAYGSDPKRKRMRDAARSCPADRLLVETDAPDMVPPEDKCLYDVRDEEGERVHHPGEIITAYRFLAEVREVSFEELSGQVEGNFRRLFG